MSFAPVVRRYLITLKTNGDLVAHFGDDVSAQSFVRDGNWSEQVDIVECLCVPATRHTENETLRGLCTRENALETAMHAAGDTYAKEKSHANMRAWVDADKAYEKCVSDRSAFAATLGEA